MAKRKSVKNESRVVRDTLTGKLLSNSSRDNWSAFDALDDSDIERAVADDADAAPIGDDAFWARAMVVMPVLKQAISIRLDEDVLAFFKDTGPGYQSRINAVLRSYMAAQK